MKAKQIAYPNLLETMKLVVASHKNVHGAVAEHAETHATNMDNRRQQLSIKRQAARLMKAEEEK